MELARLVVRQVAEGVEPAEEEPSPGNCSSGNEFDGRIGLRVSSLFVILIGSMLGAVFPVWAKRHPGMGIPDWSFFVAKYFGSGVIIATAFIHLLAPANEALGNECLTGVVTEYPWPEAIALMTVFLMFFLELMTMRYGNFGGDHAHGHDHSHTPRTDGPDSVSLDDRDKHEANREAHGAHGNHAPGQDHLGHSREHTDNSMVEAAWQERGLVPESYAAQMTAIFILEFGVIFHSIFIGLTLAVSGPEFVTLYVVLVFHQTFEGLGLGARLAMVPWPASKKWTPYLLGIAYGLSTPIAIAVGLGVRNTYPPESATTLIVNGVFDSISAGILIYTGLVELMAHEFMFSPHMQKSPIGKVLSAFLLMCLGAGLMALLGKWA
ncbi:putative Low-affinity zinc transporter of the plasma membrane [Massariosphaeria phaeospora]|uniref:Putative Low-affinity zinc transporter of the plasma membrane n=1 Tax=Massariosphaeria phaeospora TaxID=100035 RepID=A0A7C8MGF0_9PLEO|nr:putative Low-affinity zinc transporter of the plasma membrane [Massariosphaeria phaeospora]